MNKILKKHFLIICSGIFFVLGVITPSKYGLLFGAIISILGIYSFNNRNRYTYLGKKWTVLSAISFILAEGLFFRFLYNRWMSAISIQFICDRLNCSKEVFVLISSAIITLGASIFITNLIKWILSEKEIHLIKEHTRKTDWRIVGFVLLVAVIGITLCSRTSPLYSFNDSFDSHIYFTIGRGMTEGKVLYRDLLDQKGPYIYFIHAIAALVDSKYFTGVYLIQIVFFFATLMIAVKTIKLVNPKDKVIYFGIPVFAAVILSSFCYWYGNNAEEYCWPSLLFGIYILFKNLQKNQMPTNRDYFLIGITSGFILWIKFNFLAFYIGWIIVPAIMYIQRKEWKKLFIGLGFIILGVLVISLPVLLYFGFNHALIDLWQSYFYNNLFVYKAVSITEYRYGMIQQVFYSLWEQGNLNRFLSILLILSFMWVWSKTTTTFKWAFMLMFGILSLVVMGIGVTYLYYYSIFSVFALFSILYIYDIINYLYLNNLFNELIVVGSAFLLIITQSRNISFIGKPESDYPQNQFAYTINKSKNPTLLNYNMLDGGFYTASGIIPDTKYFFRINMPIQEQFDTQDRIINNGEVEYIVSREYYEFPLYTLVQEGDHDNGEGNVHYYLYRLNTSN